jgi:MerR family transcriptional regulator/heat shock protein HspR
MVRLLVDDEDAPLYSVGQVADMLEVPQAYLRRLDEHAVVRPSRSSGGQRRYSRREIERLQRANDLVEQGLTLAGVRRVMELEDRVSELEAGRRQTEGGAGPAAGLSGG